MRIDKKTGDIIFDDNIVLKAGMTIDEIKNSRVKELLREKSLKEIDKASHLLLKPIKENSDLLYIDIRILINKVKNITISIGEAVNIYNEGISRENFTFLVKKHEIFIKQSLVIDKFENKLRFTWGYIEIGANINIPVVEIELVYF